MKTLHNTISVALGALLVTAFSPVEAQTPSTTPANPVAVPVEVSGVLYGTVVNGGTSGYGAIWEYVESTGTFSILYSFDGVSAATPYGKLIYASDGYLYGTTKLGGNRPPGAPAPNGYGGVYRIHPDGTGFTYYPIPYSTSNPNAYGHQPTMGLVEDPVGVAQGLEVFYGTTNTGGVNNAGTIYEFSGGSFTKLYDFPAVASNGTNSVGANPMCELVLQSTTSARYLFGTCSAAGPGVGGSSPGAGGTVFSFAWPGPTAFPTASTGSANLVQAFPTTDSNGMNAPGGSLVQITATVGNTLGTMLGTVGISNPIPNGSTSIPSNDAGGVFSITNGSFGVYSLLDGSDVDYDNRVIQGGVQAQVGRHTSGQICLGTDGCVYVTSPTAGHIYNVPTPPHYPSTEQDGSVYRINPDLSRQLVWVFRADNDATLCNRPSMGVVQASDGCVYGVTTGNTGSNGGIGNGAIFRFPLNPTGQLTLVHQF